MSVNQSKKNFKAFVDTALLNGGLNRIIFRALFFDFFALFIIASSWSHFGVLNISTLGEIFDSPS